MVQTDPDQNECEIAKFMGPNRRPGERGEGLRLLARPGDHQQVASPITVSGVA